MAREAGTSKKDPATRRKELLDYASPGLLAMIAEKGEEMVRDAGAGLVVQEVMLLTVGGKLILPSLYKGTTLMCR
jgi:pumilio family protein 6